MTGDHRNSVTRNLKTWVRTRRLAPMSTVHWSRNPRMWGRRGQVVSLGAAIDEVRATRLRTRQQRILREYAQMCGRLRQLLMDVRLAKRLNDRGATLRLANEIATFYQESAAFEDRLDSMLTD